MRILIFGMPVVAVVAALSLCFQRSLFDDRDHMGSNIAPLPETARIVNQQMNRERAFRQRAGLPPYHPLRYDGQSGRSAPSADTSGW